VVGVAGEEQGVSAGGLAVVVEVENGGRVRAQRLGPVHRLQVDHPDPATTAVIPATGQHSAQTGDESM
jgi:hypothetical protein